jgi:hypothetical protein
MKVFEFEITETLQRTVKVEADDLAEATVKAESKYLDGDIVLDSNYLTGYEINLIGGSEC